MVLEPRILAKVDSRLRTQLRNRDSGLTARVPVSAEQWAVWKRYCDLAGVSAGGGLAVLVDHELASMVGEEVGALAEQVKAREQAVTARETDVAAREEAVARLERFCEFREQQLDAKERHLEEAEQRIDSRQRALEMLASASQPRAPIRATPKPKRNEPCWCGSGKKYKACHYEWDRLRG